MDTDGVQMVKRSICDPQKLFQNYIGNVPDSYV